MGPDKLYLIYGDAVKFTFAPHIAKKPEFFPFGRMGMRE